MTNLNGRFSTCREHEGDIGSHDVDFVRLQRLRGLGDFWFLRSGWSISRVTVVQRALPSRRRLGLGFQPKLNGMRSVDQLLEVFSGIWAAVTGQDVANVSPASVGETRPDHVGRKRAISCWSHGL